MPRKRDRESRPDSAAGTEAVKVPTWMRDGEMPPEVRHQAGPNSEEGLGAVNVPAADGYHFGDDHPWSRKQQADLVTSLARLEESIPRD
jgi:hypothetical protein